jgi:hypothetical protein
VSAACLWAAPGLLFGYGVVRLLDPSHSPGVVWTVSHVLYLLGYVAFGGAALAVCHELRAEGGGVLAVGRALVAVGWLGVAAGVGQSVIDLVAGASAVDKAERAVVADRLREAVPGAGWLLYGVGPALAYLAVIGLLALAAARPARRVPWWSPGVALVASGLPAVGLDLIPVAAVLMLVALWPVHRGLRSAARV